MKTLPITAVLLFLSFFSSAHANGNLLNEPEPIDSSRFKSPTVFVNFSPLMISPSLNIETSEPSVIFSNRIGVNWITKKNRKFQVFGSLGTNVALFGDKIKTSEIGFAIGKLIKGKGAGFVDLNAGLSYFRREITIQSFSFWGPASPDKVREVHTFGIPFSASFYGDRLPMGLGIGLAGNLNVYQPYIGLIFHIRLGNPLKK